MAAVRKTHFAVQFSRLATAVLFLVMSSYFGLAVSSKDALAALEPETWNSTGSMWHRRGWHISALLPDGRVLVAGGYNGTYLDSAELYDPGTGTWSFTDSMTDPRRGHRASVLGDGRVLVSGGRFFNGNFYEYLSSAEIYNPETESWTITGSMSITRHYHTSTLLQDGRVLVAGGYYRDFNGNFYHLNSAEIYDPQTGQWSLTGSMAATRGGHTATLLEDGRVMVAGGVNSAYLASAEIFDPQTGTWSTTGSSNVARAGHTATMLPDGLVLVASGSSGGTTTFTTSAELYDPASGTWSLTGSLNQGREWHTATLLPVGLVLVAGGHSLSSAEIYNLETGTWSLTGSMADRRECHSATLLPSGMVLVVGGHYDDRDNNPVGSDYMLFTAELFLPNSLLDASSDAYMTEEDTPLQVSAAAGVLANDTDPDGDPLTAALETPPLHGELVLSPDGSFLYTPDLDYFGSDQFTYRACDSVGYSGCDLALVSLDILPVQDAPNVADDAYSTIGNQVFEALPPGVLLNDLDVDGDPLSAAILTKPLHGVVNLVPDGSFTYTPEINYSGLDEFTYQACDNAGPPGCNSARVILTVHPGASLPVANSDAYQVRKDGSLEVLAANGVLANDVDLEGDPLQAFLDQAPGHGQLVLSPDGSFTYVPDKGFLGEDAFTYRACEDSVPPRCTKAEVLISVVLTNSPPVAVADAYQARENSKLQIPANTGVLANDRDADGDLLTAALASLPEYGDLVLNPDGSFIYTPSLNYFGIDTFTYQACDNAKPKSCTTAAVTITIQEVEEENLFLPLLFKGWER
jgi:hypothetical protein